MDITRKGEYTCTLDKNLVENMSESLADSAQSSEEPLKKEFERFVQRDISRRVCSEGEISAFFQTSMSGIKPPAVPASVYMVSQDKRFSFTALSQVGDVENLGKWEWRKEALRIRMCAERACIFGVSFYPKSEFSKMKPTEALGQAVQVLENPVFEEMNLFVPKKTQSFIEENMEEKKSEPYQQ